MSTLKEIFDSTKPKSTVKYEKFNFVNVPSGYRMPEMHRLFEKKTTSSSKDTKKNMEDNYSSQIDKTSHGKNDTQNIFINGQKDVFSQVSNIQNFEDDNYDDFYDDNWVNETNKANEQNICNTNLNIANSNKFKRNYCINGSIDNNNDISNNNTMNDDTINHMNGDFSYNIFEQYEDDLYNQENVFLKSSAGEFNDTKDLLLYDKIKEIYETLNKVFGHNSFIHEQKEAIVATLLGHDVFLLMPNGSGKSLCYQLTSIIDCGITVVVAPTKTFIENEISKLTQLNIQVYDLISHFTKTKFRNIYNEITSKNSNIKLLYVTPEIINGSEEFQKLLSYMHREGILSRFVIKEAHYITELSSTFRPNFSGLSYLRRNFKNPVIPIMALSSGATPKAIMRTKILLSMQCPKTFISTFDRPNLIDCEKVHEILKKYDISSVVYHSKMTAMERAKAKHEWMSNEVQVICRPMFSDRSMIKSDVRFIVHFCMPNSIENYYEESGHAGRDGLPSYCAILYKYSDSLKHKRVIENSSSNIFSSFLMSKYRSEIQHAKVNQILAYCETISECRRKMLVEYFGEMYDYNNCLKNSKTTCNNCELANNPVPLYKLFDLTIEAVRILNTALVVPLTVKQMAECYRGRLNKNSSLFMDLQSTDIFGRGASLSETDATRFIIKLITNGYLRENLKTIEGENYSNVAGYLSVTSRGEKFLASVVKPRIFFYISIETRKRRYSRNLTLTSHND
ncbi:Bloom syndrome protein [Strongyloides ratti]|uniref:DNA 3'-5' helicase n=1 Tax=Strongyloides ratti TaxID=34506 RepID=A0A090KYR3_STRRB|nr:Bloom syndrome protein [Strongyloides ratti]CEF62576.1 Bloom syndrome protein [Strongyloides ratti]